MTNNPWKQLLVHQYRQDVCVPPPPPGPKDELWRKEEGIPCTATPGVDSQEADKAPKVYTERLVPVPASGQLPLGSYQFWAGGGSGSPCRAPKTLPEPELDPIRQPTEERLCGKNECDEPDLSPGCPYDLPVLRAGLATGQVNPGCLVVRVAGQIVFNRVPVLVSSPPEPAPGPRLGVAPTPYCAELTPSSRCDLQTKCTEITYAEGYAEPTGLDNLTQTS